MYTTYQSGFETKKISDHQQSRGYEKGPRKGRNHMLLRVADLYKKFGAASHIFPKLVLEIWDFKDL